MVTATLAGMLLNWSAPLLVIAAAALGATGYAKSSFRIPWATIVLGGAVITVVVVGVYGFAMRLGRVAARRTGWVLAGVAAITVALATAWAIEAGYRTVVAHSGWWRASTLAGGALAAIPAVMRFIPLTKRPLVRTILLRVALLLCSFVLPLGAIGLLYGLTYAATTYTIARYAIAGWVVVLAVIAFFGLDINETGLHRLYRDQLARSFVLSAPTDTPVTLSAMNPLNSAPYQLINCTLNVPTSTHPSLRERRSDFFLFSKHWCGSPATSYVATTSWTISGAALDIATAMAISGAAVAPNMGLGSVSGLRALMTFLNVRLGFWIRQPAKKAVSRVPGFMCLLREMTGVGMSEKRAWLNLSDGGHIENMGVDQLLRRRCKYIICIDGESDPQCSFHGLMTLVRHAQIDVGVRIASALDNLRPGANGVSQTHSALFRVYYPGGGQGLMLYLKLSVTGNEPELIRRYRLLHPEFPHQSTTDQFFDQEQFEAYRQLGAHVAEGLFTPALVGNVQPADMPHWFRQLALNLLDPETTLRH